MPDVQLSAGKPTITTRWFGQIRVDAIDDMDVRLDVERMYAGRNRVPDRPIRELAEAYPREFTASSWRFVVRGFLIRVADRTVLVDGAVGPAERPLAIEFGIKGHLLEGLQTLGVTPNEVDSVVLTHFHDDHVGWLTSGKSHTVTFPRAVHYLHGADLEAARSVGDASPYWSMVFEPLEREGLLNTDDVAAIAPGVKIVAAPGHTSGHRCVTVQDGTHGLLVTGDLLHFSYQLADPTVGGPFDASPEAAAAGRAAVLDSLSTEASWTLASAHLPDAFTDLPRAQMPVFRQSNTAAPRRPHKIHS